MLVVDRDRQAGHGRISFTVMPSTYDKARRTEAAGHSRFSAFFYVAARGGKRPRESVDGHTYRIPVATVNRRADPYFY
jgi:hypothetical protein